jgi:NET1-associated nuclear protein 1 (U3 small nucleolar RNA-associated protein 17)
VLVSTYGGTIAKYNWASGRELQKWKTLSGLIRIHGLPTSNSTDSGDVILAITHRSGGERDLSRLSLSVLPEVPIKEVILLSQRRMASTVVTLEGGKVIVGFGGDRIMLGSSRDSVSGEYVWRDFSVPGKIVSLDARSGEGSVTTSKTRSIVDLVVGLQDGAILILDDILAQQKQKEKGAKDIDRIPRRLHWHRDAVSAVKWSRDGA